MFQEGLLDKMLRRIKGFIPKPFFDVVSPYYHWFLAWTGSVWYRFPSHHLKVIGVTGTKGKSTVVYMATKILEDSGHAVAAIGSLGYKIKDREWPNILKMTMPGRWKIQKFLRQALNAGCTHVVMEVPSEGLVQGRHLGVRFDCAVFTCLHPEHIESHGSFEHYREAKRVLFESCQRNHVINADDKFYEYYGIVPAKKKIFYGVTSGDLRASELAICQDKSEFVVYGTRFTLHLGGRFNVYNALAALAVGAMYGVDLPTARPILGGITEIPGRLQWMQKQPFGVVVDYAHTPDSLRAVYETLTLHLNGRALICVLGAAGGGRDRWKRQKFGAIADELCDHIILTNEDPYDEDHETIIRDIAFGISSTGKLKLETVLDRRSAIARALTIAREGDIVVITGKGSETSMALANGKKIPWSDARIVQELLAR